MKKKLLTTFSMVLFLTLAYGQSINSYNMQATTSSTDIAGYLYDPGGPNANYRDSIITSFTITPTNAKPVNVQFILFNMETDIAGSGVCAYDFVEIYDAATADPTALVGRWCGNNTPPDFTSSGNTITILFTSDGFSNYPGFKMFWSTGEMTDIDREYCFAAGNGCNSAEEIHGVELNDLSNSSVTCTASGYSDYTHLVANVNITDVYELIVTPEPNSSPGTKHFAWLDQNGDGGFNSDELIALAGDETGTGSTVTGAVAINPGAKLGLTRLRVRSILTPDPGIGIRDPLSPCGQGISGEVEDYSVLISDPANPFPECAGYVYPADLSTDICTSFLMTWNPATTGTTITYDIQLWDNNDNLIVEKLAWPNTSYSINNLNPNSDYVGLITSKNENGQAYFCDSVHFSTGAENPSIIIQEQNLKVCQGTTVNFNIAISNGSTINNYNWFDTGISQLDNNTIASPAIILASATGSYPLQLQIEDDRNCLSNIDSVNFEILQSPIPDVLSMVKATFCNNEPYALTYDNAPSNIYEYSIDGGTNWLPLNPNYINNSIYLVDLPMSNVSFKVIENLGSCSASSNQVNGSKYAAVTNPEISLTEGEPENCEGDLVTITCANYSSNLSWNNLETTAAINPTSNDSFYVSYTDNNNCSVYSDTIALIFNPRPDKPIISYSSNGVLSVVNNQDYYTWLKDNIVVEEGVGLFEITPLQNGSFEVIATNAFDCSSEISDAYLVEDVSINEFQNSTLNELVFYPNPASDIISYISNKNTDLQILNMDGRFVKQINLIKGKNVINIDLPKGVYFIRLKQTLGNDLKLQKLVIE
jgi:hypothetical protein